MTLKLPPLLKLKRKKINTELPIPKGAVTWLMFCLFITIAWHIPHTPVWVLAVVVLVGGFSYRRILQEKPLPSKTLRFVLTIASMVGVVITYNSFLGRDPGITTLILLSNLKLMELKSRRDFMFIVFMCYFLIFGNFLYDQSLIDLTFTVTAFIFITTAILRLNHPPDRPVKLAFLLKFSFRLFVFALPFTVTLFLLFPRTYGPFWNLPRGGQKAESGFSSAFRLGQVAELAENNASAFQVEFPDNNMPAPKDLYFRGLILWFTDGNTWYRGMLPTRFNRSSRTSVEGILQRITVKPHFQRWLFALDRPVAFPRWCQISAGGIFTSVWRLEAPYRYSVISRIDAAYDFLPKVHRQWALQLPRKPNKRIMELARQWRKRASTDAELIQIAEEFFKGSSFTYSLRPGLLDRDDPLSDFLFNVRKGFCEHYAAAFTFLMRCAGVPARLVAGYQGGEYNPVGKYLEVRQSDAHAWSEVWLEGSGWQRVDPTAWVSPERIEYGMELSQQLSSDLSDEGRSEAIRMALRKSFFKRALKFLKNHWDNIRYKWDVWIISYDIFRQRNFLRSLGLGRVDRLSMFLAVLISIPILLFILSFLLKRRTLSSDPLVRLYSLFCSKLGKAGLQRMRWEGPVHFSRRAVEKFPQKALEIQQVTHLFVHLRYGRLEVTRLRLKELKRYIRKL